MTQTPWGIADYESTLGEGVTTYSTPSHGGIHVSKEVNEQVPKEYRDFAAKWSKGWGDQWYEEDCAALAIVVTFPNLFPHLSTEDIDKFRGLLDIWVNEKQ